MPTAKQMNNQRIPKSKKKKTNNKPSSRPKQQRSNNVRSVTSNPFFNAKLTWTFVLDTDSADLSFGIKISDVFLYIREQFEIDETMKLYFKIKGGSFMDYGYRIHTCKMFNFPGFKTSSETGELLGVSAVKEFFPKSFSSPNGFKLRWNATTRNHTFSEEDPNTFLCVIRAGKPISETVKSKMCVCILDIGWRTINEDPIREIPTSISSLQNFSTSKKELNVPKSRGMFLLKKKLNDEVEDLANLTTNLDINTEEEAQSIDG